MPIRSRCQLCNAVIEYAADSLAEAVFVNCPTCGEETEIRPITVGGRFQPIQFQVAEPPRPKSPWRQDGPLVLTLVGVGAAIGIPVMMIYLPKLFAGTLGIFGVLLVLAVSLAFYFLPTFAAKGKPQFVPVLLVNLLLGWTFLGWVIALVWAATGNDNKLRFNRRG